MLIQYLTDMSLRKQSSHQSHNFTTRFKCNTIHYPNFFRTTVYYACITQLRNNPSKFIDLNQKQKQTKKNQIKKNQQQQFLSNHLRLPIGVDRNPMASKDMSNLKCIRHSNNSLYISFIAKNQIIHATQA